MPGPLLVLQSQINTKQLEQAFDTGTVTAIFHNGCRFLSFLSKSHFTKLCEQAELHEKLLQLRELQAELVFAEELDSNELLSLITDTKKHLSF